MTSATATPPLETLVSVEELLELAEAQADVDRCNKAKAKAEAKLDVAKARRKELQEKLASRVPLNANKDSSDVHELHGKTLRRLKVVQPERFDLKAYLEDFKRPTPRMAQHIKAGSSYELWTLGDAED